MTNGEAGGVDQERSTARTTDQHESPSRPVLYLDVDDTLLCFPPDRTREWWLANKGGAPADGVREFLEWARATCEVRWLTMWAMRGHMGAEGEAKLARLLRVPLALVEGCDNPLEHNGFKTNGIDWDEHRDGREWFWVEDEHSEREAQVLRGNHAMDRFILTKSSHDAGALLQSMRAIQARLAATMRPERAPALAVDPSRSTPCDDSLIP